MYVFLSSLNVNESSSWHNYHLKRGKTANQSWVAWTTQIIRPQRTFLFIHIITAWSLQAGNEPFANETRSLAHNTLTYSHFPANTPCVVDFGVRDVSRVFVCVNGRADAASRAVTTTSIVAMETDACGNARIENQTKMYLTLIYTLPRVLDRQPVLQQQKN